MKAIRERGTRDLLRLQKNFNVAFRRKRDAGENFVGIYRYLKEAEAELSRRGARW